MYIYFYLPTLIAHPLSIASFPAFKKESKMFINIGETVFDNASIFLIFSFLTLIGHILKCIKWKTESLQKSKAWWTTLLRITYMKFTLTYLLFTINIKFAMKSRILTPSKQREKCMIFENKKITEIYNVSSSKASELFTVNNNNIFKILTSPDNLILLMSWEGDGNWGEPACKQTSEYHHGCLCFLLFLQITWCGPWAEMNGKSQRVLSHGLHPGTYNRELSELGPTQYTFSFFMLFN